MTGKESSAAPQRVASVMAKTKSRTGDILCLMVLTKEELISALQNEVRVVVHLAGKVDKSKVDYRPTPKQRSTLELLQYLAVMGPTQLAVIEGGSFDRPALSAAWGPADKAAKAMD